METFNTMTTANQTRPCWVDGRRAIFHRWTDSARPVKPKGMEDENTLDRYQLHTVHGLVEYEDGHMERVWPHKIQFADGGNFAAWDWETMEAIRDDRDPIPVPDFLTKDMHLPADPVPAPVPRTYRHCYNCKNSPKDTEPCELSNYDCRRCDKTDCICKSCDSSKSNWEAEEE